MITITYDLYTYNSCQSIIFFNVDTPKLTHLSILMHLSVVWKCLQWGMQSSCSTLPSLQDIYLKPVLEVGRYAPVRSTGTSIF